MQIPEVKTNSIDEVQHLIDQEVFLTLAVVDVQVYDQTLVVMTSHSVPRAFVRMLLRKIWNGPVEVYCASALFAGGNIALT